MPSTPRRILVAGASGSGKTTLAARIASVTGIPHTEIDALHWQQGWTANPRFAAEVHALAEQPNWVTEWQYASARPVLAGRAELLVWIDLPRAVVLARVVRRTVHRRVHRLELWNGNLEPPLSTILTDPEHIVRWSMSTWSQQPQRIREALRTHPRLRLVRLRSARDARRFLRGLGARAR